MKEKKVTRVFLSQIWRIYRKEIQPMALQTPVQKSSIRTQENSDQGKTTRKLSARGYVTAWEMEYVTYVSGVAKNWKTESRESTLTNVEVQRIELAQQVRARFVPSS